MIAIIILAVSLVLTMFAVPLAVRAAWSVESRRASRPLIRHTCARCWYVDVTIGESSVWMAAAAVALAAGQSLWFVGATFAVMLTTGLRLLQLTHRHGPGGVIASRRWTYRPPQALGRVLQPIGPPPSAR